MYTHKYNASLVCWSPHVNLHCATTKPCWYYTTFALSWSYNTCCEQKSAQDCAVNGIHAHISTYSVHNYVHVHVVRHVYCICTYGVCMHTCVRYVTYIRTQLLPESAATHATARLPVSPQSSSILPLMARVPRKPRVIPQSQWTSRAATFSRHQPLGLAENMVNTHTLLLY